MNCPVWMVSPIGRKVSQCHTGKKQKGLFSLLGAFLSIIIYNINPIPKNRGINSDEKGSDFGENRAKKRRKNGVIERGEGV